MNRWNFRHETIEELRSQLTGWYREVYDQYRDFVSVQIDRQNPYFTTVKLDLRGTKSREVIFSELVESLVTEIDRSVPFGTVKPEVFLKPSKDEASRWVDVTVGSEMISYTVPTMLIPFYLGKLGDDLKYFIELEVGANNVFPKNFSASDDEITIQSFLNKRLSDLTASDTVGLFQTRTVFPNSIGVYSCRFQEFDGITSPPSNRNQKPIEGRYLVINIPPQCNHNAIINPLIEAINHPNIAPFTVAATRAETEFGLVPVKSIIIESEYAAKIASAIRALSTSPGTPPIGG